MLFSRGAVPAHATAVVANVTALDPDAAGSLTVDACASARRNASSLNVTTGVNGADELIAALDDNGKLCVYTYARTHLLIDVVGYIQPPTADLHHHHRRFSGVHGGGDRRCGHQRHRHEHRHGLV